MPHVDSARGRLACAAMALALAASCGSGTFTLGDPTVDAGHTCAQGSRNAAYDLVARVAADNPTSQAVAVRSIDAVMVVAAVHGQWLQAAGARYEAGGVGFSPQSVGANSRTTLTVTVPSACTNYVHQGTNDDYADYSVQLTVVTSAGTFHLTSQNRHRISAP